MAWTEERTRILTRLWADGWTGGEIGERLGLTRGAVISKLHRLGLARGGKNQTAAAQALPSSRHQPAPKPSAAPDTVSSSPGAPEWENHAGHPPAIACEPDPSGMKFVAPPDERSRYERRADLIREVERQVNHDLTRLRQLGWSQEDLPKRASVALLTVRDFEKGRRTAIANNLGAITRALASEDVQLLFADDGTPEGIKISR
jgi:hypothetical protein